MSESASFIIGVVMATAAFLIAPIIIEEWGIRATVYDCTWNGTYYDVPWCSMNPLFATSVCLMAFGGFGYIITSIASPCDEGTKFIAFCTFLLGAVSMILAFIFGGGMTVCG